MCIYPSRLIWRILEHNRIVEKELLFHLCLILKVSLDHGRPILSTLVLKISSLWIWKESGITNSIELKLEFTYIDLINLPGHPKFSKNRSICLDILIKAASTKPKSIYHPSKSWKTRYHHLPLSEMIRIFVFNYMSSWRSCRHRAGLSIYDGLDQREVCLPFCENPLLLLCLIQSLLILFLYFLQ